jgi:hypothetical protein
MAENKRLSVPDKVKAQLWVAAGGRCEFKCCNRRLDRNLITKQKLFAGEHAHIIGESVHGPRGDAGLSKKLAQDASNLMLVCRECHSTIDRLADDYPVNLLLEMKKVHEDRIQRLYDIKEAKESVPVVLRHPINKTHVPQFNSHEAEAAILRNSSFCNWPGQRGIDLDYRLTHTREQDPAYWTELAQQMRGDYERQLYLAGTSGHPQHLSIFAFAPMALNMQLGLLIGNKIEASTYQWSRTTQSWTFPEVRTTPRQMATFNTVPADVSEGVLAVKFSLSGEIRDSDVMAAIPGAPIIRFGVVSPTPMLVEDAEDVRQFRTDITKFLAQVRNAGYRRLEVFPAMPLSLAVEFGRQLLPKADPAISVWDYQDSKFTRALDLQC